MVTRIKADSVSIDANAVEATVLELTPPTGKQYKVLELALQAAGAGYFRIYLNNDKICGPLDKDALAIDPRRILVDWVLNPGDVLKIVFTDTSGAANTGRYLIVYEETVTGGRAI